MTEDERFTIKGSWSKSLNRLKGLFCDNGKDLYITDVVDLLNKLSKENEELKEILKYTYEVHECETCKHNRNFNWLDPATMTREYDSECNKGLHYGEEVHDCKEYELDLEMFKERVKG